MQTEMSIMFNDIYIYIYIYRERERVREINRQRDDFYMTIKIGFFIKRNKNKVFLTKKLIWLSGRVSMF